VKSYSHLAAFSRICSDAQTELRSKLVKTGKNGFGLNAILRRKAYGGQGREDAEGAKQVNELREMRFGPDGSR
jgi:hypothetical protein